MYFIFGIQRNNHARVIHITVYNNIETFLRIKDLFTIPNVDGKAIHGVIKRTFVLMKMTF